MVEVRKSQIESLIRACRLVSRMNKNRPDGMKSEQLYYAMLDKYFENVLKAKQEGGFVAGHTVFFPVEVLYAMGIAPLHNEVTTWTSALLLGNQAEFLAGGAEAGLAAEICSPHRGLAGAYLRDLLPKPNAFLWSNLICDNTSKSGELIMELTGCPGFFLDHPFGKSKLEEAYMVEELKDMVSFLEKTSGRKMDWDRLSRNVAEMDRQIKLQSEICELRKAVPSPFPARRFLEFLTVDYMFASQPEATEYLVTLRDELKEMVAQSRGAVNPERFRLMSFFVPPIYLIASLEAIFQEYGATSVVEPLFTYWKYEPLDPSRPLESVVKKSYLIPESRTMYGPLGQPTLDEISSSAREYRVDGAIYYAFIGCRHSCAAIKMFKDLLNSLDVPVLTLDCDIVDPTVNNQSEVRQKMEQFFELLEDR
ncbi:MAG: 2-hydroxyacyl-CoA dehydratase [Dehalococcoidales bacterium]|nr:2-hydroxyacyl-CoA dehydratase [Dehalococcoidales bacterium]